MRIKTGLLAAGLGMGLAVLTFPGGRAQALMMSDGPRFNMTCFGNVNVRPPSRSAAAALPETEPIGIAGFAVPGNDSGTLDITAVVNEDGWVLRCSYEANVSQNPDGSYDIDGSAASIRDNCKVKGKPDENLVVPFSFHGVTDQRSLSALVSSDPGTSVECAGAEEDLAAVLSQ